MASLPLIHASRRSTQEHSLHFLPSRRSAPSSLQIHRYSYSVADPPGKGSGAFRVFLQSREAAPSLSLSQGLLQSETHCEGPTHTWKMNHEAPKEPSRPSASPALTPPPSLSRTQGARRC